MHLFNDRFLLSYYVVDFDPFAFRFPDGFFLEGVRWYGLSYFVGFVIGYLLLNYYYKKGRSPLNPESNANLITYMLFGVVIGGRLGYMLFYDFANFSANPLLFFQVWKGGMASHGGFIGGIFALWLFGIFNKVPFLRLCDIVCTICTPGIFLGRIANFVNGELWGKVSDVPWAMIFPNSSPHTAIENIAARHPSQLYEAFGEGILLFAYTQWRFWSFRLPKGQLAGEFLIAYALIRIVCEVFREPDFGISLIFGLSRGTFYSLFCILAGAVFIVVSRLRNENSKNK